MKCRDRGILVLCLVRRRHAAKPLALALLCIGVLLSTNKPVGAAIITYDFSGTLNKAYANPSGPGPATQLPGVVSGLGNGQAYTGTVSFDDQALFVGNPTLGDYRYTWDVGTVTIDIGGYLYSFARYGTPGQSQNIDITANIPSQPNDLLSFNGQDGPGPTFGLNWSSVSLGLLGQPGFLSSTTTVAGLAIDPSLLISGPGTSGVDLTEIFQNDPADSFLIDAKVTAISPAGPTPAVPEPGTLMIFAQAMLLGGCGWWRRRKAQANSIVPTDGTYVPAS